MQESDQPELKKILRNLGNFQSATAKIAARNAESEPKHSEAIEPLHLLQKAIYPPKQPEPVSIRLEDLRLMNEDELMKWLTTESAHPDRPLDEGTKMAITTELMRRQAAKFERPAWWRDRNYWVALVAAIGGVIAAVPIVVDWLKK